MKRKTIAFLLTAAMVLGMLTACGSSDSSEETSAPAETEGTTAEGYGR